MKRGSLAFCHSFYLSFILPAGEGESGSVTWSESDLPSSLTGRAIARKARGPGFDSRLGCGGHFFLSPIVVLFLLSLSKYLFCIHPECFLKIFSTQTPTFSSLRGFHWVGRPVTQWIVRENVSHWHSVNLSIFLSFSRLERERVAP